ASGLTSLTSADPASLQAIRVSPDSVTHLRNALGSMGIPERTQAVPGGRENSGVTLSSRFDFIPTPATSPAPLGDFVNFGGPGSTTDAYYLQLGGTLRGSDGINIGVTSGPAGGAKERHRDGRAQFIDSKHR